MVYRLMVWNVPPEQQRALYRKLYLRPTTKNPNHYWAHYSSKIKQIEDELTKLGLKFSWTEDKEVAKVDTSYDTRHLTDFSNQVTRGWQSKQFSKGVASSRSQRRRKRR